MQHPLPEQLPPRAPRRLRQVALAALGLCLWVACGTLVQPQEWDSSRGPVVPHDDFPADCSLCHVPPGWHTLREDFTFDHEAETGVALLGAHAEAECLRCHNDRGPVQRYAAQGCAGCHVDPHRGKLGTSCDACHDEGAWLPREVIAQHARTRFPLVGAHAVAQCWQCHPGAQVGNFEGLDPSCAACHMPDLSRATSPDHAAQGWTTDCQRCHLPIAWSPARFDHPSTLPLTGAHGALDCATCHGDTGNFGGLDPACVACHMDDYQSVTDPDHVAAGFDTQCQICHNDVSWSGARFQHPGNFPLDGAHATAGCAACHQNGYTGTPSLCVDCHLPEFQGTTDPNHQTSGFGTDCQVCHNTTTWQGATFNHRFPISAGDHSGLSCTDCHTTPGSSIAFSCIDCHEHTQARMADEHREVQGYVWSSPDCLRCHPDGRER